MNNNDSNGIEKLAEKSSEMKLLEKRMLFISEPISAKISDRVTKQLLALDSENNQPITLYLNSPGGEVLSGFAIYDTMRFVNSPVRVLTTGFCASIATIINLGAAKEFRWGLPNSRYLIHQPLIGGHIQGQASDLEITAREIIKTRRKINEMLSRECSQPMEKVEEDTARDYWMTAVEALEYGLISKIIESAKEMPT